MSKMARMTINKQALNENVCFYVMSLTFFKKTASFFCHFGTPLTVRKDEKVPTSSVLFCFFVSGFLSFHVSLFVLFVHGPFLHGLAFLFLFFSNWQESISVKMTDACLVAWKMTDFGWCWRKIPASELLGFGLGFLGWLLCCNFLEKKVRFMELFSKILVPFYLFPILLCGAVKGSLRACLFTVILAILTILNEMGKMSLTVLNVLK